MRSLFSRIIEFSDDPIPARLVHLVPEQSSIYLFELDPKVILSGTRKHKEACDEKPTVVASTLFDYEKLSAVAVEKMLPLMGCDAEQIDNAGYLLAYSTSRYSLGHRAAWDVDRVLTGTKPQDLPIEAPTRFDLLINLRTAKSIGLTGAPSVLARADRVIK